MSVPAPPTDIKMGPNELTAIRMSVLFLASVTLICNARGRAVGDTLCFGNASQSLEARRPPPHLQDVIQGLGAKRPASVEQSVAGLLHLVLLPPRGLGIPGLGALQTLASALKLLAHLLEPAHVSEDGARGGGEDYRLLMFPFPAVQGRSGATRRR